MFALDANDFFSTEKTKIFGKIRYDLRVEPRNLREEEELLAKRIFEAENSKSKLQIISRNKASSIINPGSAGSVSWGGNFIVRVLVPHYSLMLLLTSPIRKTLPPPSSPRRAKFSRRPVSRKISFSILFSIVSGNISIGQ